MLLAHIPDMAWSEVAPSALPLPIKWITLGAQDAVTLFFVLSGFLITYLLLRERQETGRIKTRAFYMRRILRIWMLYYLVIAAAIIVVIPGRFDSGLALILTLFFLSNVGRAWVGLPQILLGHLWTVSAEEQFYLSYPILIRLVKNMPVLLGSVIALKALLVMVVPAGTPLHEFLLWNRFEAMAFGGLAAWAYLTRQPILRWLCTTWTVGIAAALCLIVIVFDMPAYTPVYDFGFAALASVVTERRDQRAGSAYRQRCHASAWQSVVWGLYVASDCDFHLHAKYAFVPRYIRHNYWRNNRAGCDFVFHRRAPDAALETPLSV